MDARPRIGSRSGALLMALGVWALGPATTAAEVRPEERTNAALLRTCQGGAEGAAWCEAYLLGVADAMAAFGAGGHKAGLCGPDYRAEELDDLYVGWARENPGFMDLDMLLGVHFALRERWPCTR